MRLCRLEQHVTLLAKGKLDHVFRGEVGTRQRHLLVGDGNIVHAQAAALDLAPRLAVGGDQAGLDESREYADASFKFAARTPPPGGRHRRRAAARSRRPPALSWPR